MFDIQKMCIRDRSEPVTELKVSKSVDDEIGIPSTTYRGVCCGWYAYLIIYRLGYFQLCYKMCIRDSVCTDPPFVINSLYPVEVAKGTSNI